MDPRLHRVVGVKPSLDQAHQARGLMMVKGLPTTAIRVLTAGSMGVVDVAGADALSNGQVVLVAHARTEAETGSAQQVVSPPGDAAAAPRPHDARRVAVPVR